MGRWRQIQVGANNGEILISEGLFVSMIVVRLYILLNFMKKVIRPNVDKNQNL